jgi:hypothetical protein
LVLPVYLVETREEALDQARSGAGRDQREFFEATMDWAPVVDGPTEQVIEAMVDRNAQTGAQHTASREKSCHGWFLI